MVPCPSTASFDSRGSHPSTGSRSVSSTAPDGDPSCRDSGGLTRVVIVPDGVVRPEADPVGDRPVLLLGLRKLLLGTERLVALHPAQKHPSVNLFFKGLTPQSRSHCPSRPAAPPSIAPHAHTFASAAMAGIDGTASRYKIRALKRDWTYRHLDGLGLTVGESERGEVCW